MGCENNYVEIIIQPNKIYNLDLSEEIGEGKLLYVCYTPIGDGGVFPVEMHSNVPMKHVRSNIIQLLPHAIKTDATETKVAVSYWFAPRVVYDDISVVLLLDGFKAYYENDYRHMLVSVQTCIEKLLYELLEKIFKTSGISSKRVNDLLKDKATFSTQLFTLLPFLVDILKIPSFSQEIVDGLRILNAERNHVIHQGKLSKDLKQDEMKKAILGSFFAYKYFKIFGNKSNFEPGTDNPVR